jgi:glycerophosphoryl diester phosphodiesterase family protein
MRRQIGIAGLVLGACGASSETPGGNIGPDGAVAVDAAAHGDGTPAMDSGGGTYRTSLAVCWTDATCPRVLALAHGGSWDPTNKPYDSNAAIAAAYDAGDDGIKIDVRVTKDDVLVIAHSSPIEIFESLDCANKKIEDMTAAQVTACHRFPSSTETFQRLDDVLGYVHGRMVVQLCVKRATDYARTIAEIHTLGAEDYAFIEINAPELGSIIPTLPGNDTVWYLVNVASDLSAVDGLLALHNPRAFMYEIDPGVDIGTIVPDKLHPAGVRAFIYDNAAAPSVAQLQAHYQAGFDAVSSQSGPNGVEARQNINTARGLTPP